ncbi:MAG: nucleotidyltransferase domain-containing protein [Bacteroidota bacterium]
MDPRHPIDPHIREQIMACLASIEAEHGVRVLYACESGSRAWGFPSADSDYDVRFIYVRPRDWYLQIDVERHRDVIERPIDDVLDVSGWDLRKALQLFRKSNPPLLEWLQSPVVYREDEGVMAEFRALIPSCFSPKAAAHHYWHMARGNFRDYLKHDRVRTKKYFYVLRPLLAVRWIEAGLGAVPTTFETLVGRLLAPGALRTAIEALVEAKRHGLERAQGPRIEAISAFIEAEMARLEASGIDAPPAQPDAERLNIFFRSVLR